MRQKDTLQEQDVVRLLPSSALLIMAVVILFPAGQGRADTLADLRTTLQGLNAGTHIHGTLDVQSVKLDPKQGKDDKQLAPVQLELQIEAGDGLGIHLGSGLLQQINAEQQAHADDPERTTPVTDLLRATDAMEVERVVSAAPGLLHELEGAGTPTTISTELDGAQVRELTMDVPLKASKKDSSNISDYKGTLSVWLDKQGVPLAYRQSFHAKFCKFFLCMSVDETQDAKLRVVDGRLIAVSYIDETKQSGLGQDGDTRKTYTLELGSATEAKLTK